jgi:hypothetical protein
MANKDGSKSGGRSKGTPNKKTLKAQDLAERLGVDPLEILLLFAKGDWKALGYNKGTYTRMFGDGGSIEVEVIDPDLRAKAAIAAVKHLYPSLKAIEITDNEGKPLPKIIVSIPGNGRESRD